MRRFVALTAIALCGSLPALSPAIAQESRERVDMEIVNKIKDEGLNRSKAMATISHVTDVFGPRLTASPQMHKAAAWTRDQLTSWGLENSHLEPWGPFGRGWSLERFSASIAAPDFYPLIAYPKAWSPSTQKIIRGTPVYLNAKTEAELEQFRGKLHRAIVLVSPPREVRALFEAPARRQTDASLLNLANADPNARRGGPPAGGQQQQAGRGQQGNRGGQQAQAQPPAQEQRSSTLLQASKWQMIHDEGAAVVLEPGRGDGGTIFVQGAQMPTRTTPRPDAAGGEAARGNQQQAAGRGGARPNPWSPNAPEMVPQVALAVEHYNRIVRMIEAGTPVELEVDILSKYHTDDLMCPNIVAEIPGTDLKDEVVMLGGHFDSWHSGTGATDNAIGCGVALEAVRILKAIEAKPRRTIRIALWTGEEQGLLGSRAYVAQHFGRAAGGGGGGGGGGRGRGEGQEPAAEGDAAQRQAGGGQRFELKPEHEKLSVYFNLDNGGGKIRGIYLQGNEAARPIFRSWLAPFGDMGASTVSLNSTGSTDHVSFDNVGLPGFQFIQDPLEYNTRTHHSSMDVYDRLIEDDVKQSSVIMASFIYHAATRDDRIPRKPLAGRVVQVPAGDSPAGTAQN